MTKIVKNQKDCWPIFPPFQAICNNFDFFYFLTFLLPPPLFIFFLGGDSKFCLKKLFIYVILMLYTKFKHVNKIVCGGAVLCKHTLVFSLTQAEQ